MYANYNQRILTNHQNFSDLRLECAYKNSLCFYSSYENCSTFYTIKSSIGCIEPHFK